MFMLKSEVVSQPSLVSDDLVQSVNQRICERWHFTIPELSCKFTQISCTLLHEIIRGQAIKFCMQYASTYICSHLSTAGAFQLGSASPLLTSLILFQVTTTCLLVPTWRSGWDHSASAMMKSWWKMSKCGQTCRWQTFLTKAYKSLFPDNEKCLSYGRYYIEK
jgi:hypothetical protein